MSDDPKDQDRVIHEVDGIEEYDNKLPNWWLGTLYGAILFAAVYWFHYHVAAFGEGPRAKWESEQEQAAAAQAANLKITGPVTAESLLALSQDKGAVAAGKTVFKNTCAACHRADGGGLVGPNLTDDFWLHGSAPDKIYGTIMTGVSDKGMPAWGPQLGPQRVQAVTAYVLTLRGTNVPGGKPPQGDRESLSQR